MLDTFRTTLRRGIFWAEWESIRYLQEAIRKKRQVHLGKEVLEHLGVQPGDKLDCELLPNGLIQIKAASERAPAAAYENAQKK